MQCRSLDHLHRDCKILPIADHLEMLSSQYLASTLRPDHPSHAVVTAPGGPRDKKKTLYSRCIQHVAPYLTNGVLDPANYKKTIDAIHTSFVAAAIARQKPNRLLEATPPEVSKSELTLLRPHRTTLTQLRSNKCMKLNDTLHRFNRAPSAVCPECRYRRQTVSHLFNCDAFPTTPPDLCVRDTWKNPVLVTNFLVTHPSFSSLPLPPDPPPPRPPPEPPPAPPPPPR